jgi:DNA polymerase-3 subunit delta'
MAFENIVGQEKAIGILKSQLKFNRIAHSYIFFGPEGVGRKKTAIELAKALNCEQSGNTPCDECVSCKKIDKMIHPDVHLIDYVWQSKVLEEKVPKSGRNVIKIGTIRAIQRGINLKLFEGRYRVFIVDSAETLNREAANCLLKTLEEPSPNSLIVLITDTLETLPGTVISRCQQIKFRMLSEEFIFEQMHRCYDVDRVKAGQISGISQGSLGKAILLKDSFDEPFGIRVTIDLWDRLRGNKIDGAELIEFCNRVGRNRDNTEKFISNLLNLARHELVSKITDRSQDAVGLILSCKKSLRYNVNMNMLVSSMLLQLKEIFYASSS